MDKDVVRYSLQNSTTWWSNV